MDNNNDITFSHRSVLLDECIEALNIKPDGIYIDGTAGGGGHSYEIAKRLESGRLIAIDQDIDAIEAAGKRLLPFADRVTLVKNNFANIGEVCKELGIDKIDGVLMDLGVSSYQLDSVDRGFSYNADAPLDMRMDKSAALDAKIVVNTYSQNELKRILFEYGEERYTNRIVSRIIEQREKAPIETTGELVNIIKYAMPREAKAGGHHPAKRTFQAIRIEVNGELSVISPAVRSAINLLNTGGHIAVITFHSLEDRIVKHEYMDAAQGCTCPKNFPICICGNKPKVKIITKKPILPSEKELDENPRSRSAKLRVAEKL